MNAILARFFPRDLQPPPRMALAASLRAEGKEAAGLGYDFHAYRCHALADAAECLMCGDKAGAYYHLGWAAHYRSVAPSVQMGRFA